MPMLFAALEMREDGAVEEIAEDILADAKVNTALFENTVCSCESDEFEDGI